MRPAPAPTVAAGRRAIFARKTPPGKSFSMVMPVGIVRAPSVAWPGTDYRTPALLGMRGATARHGESSAMTVA